MIQRTGMDKKDAWLLKLYEDSGTPPDSGSGGTEEAASLREMKDWLDARSAIRSTRPDPEAVEAVLQAAAQHATVSGARQDRPALARKRVAWRVPRRIAGGAVAALVAAVVVVGLFRTDVFAPAPTDSVSGSAALLTGTPASTEAAPSEAPPETLSPAGEAENRVTDLQGGSTGLAAVSSPDLPAASGALQSKTAPEARPDAALADASSVDAAGPLQPAAVASEQAGDGAIAQPGFILVEIPAWEDRGDVIYLQQRIQSIGDGVAGGWETPAAPLEMLPAGSGGAGFTPASDRR